MIEDPKDMDKDRVEAAFYAALEAEYTEEELENLEMDNDNVTVTFVDGAAMEFRGVNSIKLVTNLATMGFAQMMDDSGARVTIFAHTITSIIAEGSQHDK